MRVTRAEQLQRTRQVLLEVGLAVFLRRGYLATTVEEIVAEAGYTRGALYKHFGGKDGLWRAIVDDTADASLKQLVATLERVADRAELVAALKPAHDTDSTRWTLASTEFLAAAASRPESASTIVEAQRLREGELVRAIARACERLDVRPAVPLEHLVVTVTAALGSLVLRRAVDPTLDVDAAVASLLEAALPEDQR